MLDLGAPPPNQQAFPGVPPGQNPIPPNARVYGFEMGFPPQQQGLRHAHFPQGLHAPPSGAANVQSQLQHLEQQIVQEIQSLSVAQAELVLVRQLQAELLRLRQLRAPDNQHATQAGAQPPVAAPVPFVQRHEHLVSTSSIPSGSPNLPPGVTIPEGWSLLPLQNMNTLPQPQAGPSAAQDAAPTTSGANPAATGTGDLPAQPQASVTEGTPAAGDVGVTPVDTGSASLTPDTPAAPSVAAADSVPVEIVPDTLLASERDTAGPTPTVPLTQPASSSSEVPVTATTAAETEEAPLPDWSAPFVFPGQQAGEAAAAANPKVSVLSAQAGEMQEAAIASDGVTVNGSAAPVEAPTSEEDGKGKGKAKTASVEEVKEDEDEDA